MLAVVSLISFVIMTVLAFKSAGALNIYVACYGILAAIMAIVSLIVSIVSLREENTYRTIPYASTFLSIVAVLIWGAVYIGGIVL